jgi:hypothetical protein
MSSSFWEPVPCHLRLLPLFCLGPLTQTVWLITVVLEGVSWDGQVQVQADCPPWYFRKSGIFLDKKSFKVIVLIARVKQDGSKIRQTETQNLMVSNWF